MRRRRRGDDSNELITQRLTRKVGQDKARAVHLGVVIAAELLLLFFGPATEGLAHVTVGILAADHETDLAGRIGRNGGVGVFGDGKDLTADLAEVGNEGEMEPLVLGCESKKETVSKIKEFPFFPEQTSIKL